MTYTSFPPINLEERIIPETDLEKGHYSTTFQKRISCLSRIARGPHPQCTVICCIASTVFMALSTYLLMSHQK